MSSNKNSKPPSATSKVDFSKTIDKSVLKDQSVLVTGGSSGIGEGFVEALAEAGAFVTIFDLAEEQGQAVAKHLSDRGHKVQFVSGDVCSWEDQIRAFDAASTFSLFKSLDIVLAVAGVIGSNIVGWLDDPYSSEGRLKKPDSKCLDVNLKGVWYTTHLALYYFQQSLKNETRPTESKQLVYVSSLAGYTTNAYVTDYGAAKWGVRGMWRNIRDESNLLGDDTQTKFRTSLIAPWFTRTTLTHGVVPVLSRLGVPMAEVSDCVDAMLRIVCDESIKGRALAIAPNGNSFDLCDDAEGLDAGREFNTKWDGGAFGTTTDQMRRFFDSRKQSKSVSGK